jgi:hypothetical protein
MICVLDLLIIAKDAEDGRSQLYSSGLNNYGQCGHHKGTVPDVSEEGNIQKLTKVRVCVHLCICICSNTPDKT